MGALAEGLTVRDAAKAAGVGERTVSRRMADPSFRQRVVELRAEIQRQVSDGIVAMRRRIAEQACALQRSAVDRLLTVLPEADADQAVKAWSEAVLVERQARGIPEEENGEWERKPPAIAQVQAAVQLILANAEATRCLEEVAPALAQVPTAVTQPPR